MKRLKNRKALTGIIVAAATLSIGTVGFSAWMISGGTQTSDAGTLGVNVATISDYRVKLSDPAWSNTFSPTVRDATQAHNSSHVTMLVDDEAQICFGPQQGDQTGFIRASGNGVNDLEHLTLEFTFDVECLDFANHFDKLTVGFEFGGTSATGKQAWGTTLNEAATGNYITNPFPTDFSAVTLLNAAPSVESSLSDVSGYTGRIQKQCTEINGNVATFKVRLAWGWGSKFGGNNPSVHANQNDATNLDSLLTDINGLNTILDKGDGSITIKVTAVGK